MIQQAHRLERAKRFTLPSFMLSMSTTQAETNLTGAPESVPLPTGEPNAKGHIYIVDALRGFAALVVCLMHYTNSMLPKLTNPITKSLFFWGGQGVTIFFVISGFVIPYVLIRKGYTMSQFGSFIGKRFVRIDPPSYISMVATLIQWLAIDTFFHSSKQWFSGVTATRIMHNMLYTVPFVANSDYWINGVFWTLSVEYQYYFTIALLFPLMMRNKQWLFAISLIICLLPYALRPIIIDHYGVLSDHYFFTQHACVFWMGIFTAFSFARLITLRQYMISLAILTALAAHQVFIRLTHIPTPDYVMPFIYPTIALTTALLIRFVRFRSSVTTFLGTISYSLYLTHGVVGTTLEVVLIKIMPPANDITRILYQAICLICAIIVAYVFYSFVERPFVLLSPGFLKNLSSKINLLKNWQAFEKFKSVFLQLHSLPTF